MSLRPAVSHVFHPLPMNQVVANPLIFISFNRQFSIAVRNLPFILMPCLYRQKETPTITSWRDSDGLDEIGLNYKIQFVLARPGKDTFHISQVMKERSHRKG